jgi:hypothetical protein
VTDSAVQHTVSREGLRAESPDSVTDGMSVADLIKVLQLFNPAWRVFVRGYEGGLQDPAVVSGKVGLNVYDSDFYGPHGNLGNGWNDPTEIVNAVVIDRDGR